MYSHKNRLIEAIQMRIYSIPFSIYKNYPKAGPMGFLSKGLKNEFEIAVTVVI